jgi:type III restriction enzyme
VYPTGAQAERQPYRNKGRRPASYWFKQKRTGEAQQGLFQEENRDDLPLVNRLREDVRRWRESGWRGASEVTKDLLRHWTNQDRHRRLFFCQQEAVETVIYLLELRLAGLSSRTGFRNFDCSDEDLQRMLRGERPTGFQLADDAFWPTLVDQPADPSLLGLRRLGCKMATGSGKTLVMAMLIAWAFCNRGRNPQSEGFPNAVLVMAPNLTVRSRLSVLKPEEPNNYYDQFDLVPTRYRDFLAMGKVLVTNWHVFGKKSPHSDGGASYLVVDKGEEDARAFALARLGELAHRLPLLVLNDEGHHCWRPKVEGDLEVEGDSREEKAAMEREFEEARVWLDGLDRINNSGLRGPKVPCVLATVDLSATPFFLGGSGHIEGSPFPWLVSDFGLVDAIESGIVKVPRLPVLQVGGTERKDEVGRPDPKYFRLWDHLKREAKAADKKGKGFKPEAVYRLAEGALRTLAGQWHQRFEQYRAASATQQTIPPAMIVVCHETEAAEVFYRMISGERVEEVPNEDGKVEARVVYGESQVLKELANEPGVLRTLRIDSKLLAKLEGDEDASKDEKVAEVRRIIDTIGRQGQPGEHVRCIVSVSMLTEGWDANNVTQILGVRAFGSQLLCEQVVGRGLRRRSYAVNDKTGLLEPEYVDVYGIPFTLIPFKGRETEAEAPEDKPKNHVRPVAGREHLEIRAPNVQSFVYDLRLDGVECDVSKLEPLKVQDEPEAVYIDAVRGYRDQVEDAAATASPEAAGYIRQDRTAYYAQVHEQAIHFQIAQRILDRLVAGADSGKDARFRLQAKHMLFPQLVRFVRDYIATRVEFAPGVDRKEIGMQKYADRVVHLIVNGITPAQTASDAPLVPVLHKMRKFHSTADAEETTTRPVLPIERSHLNGVIYRSKDEMEAAQLLDRSPYVESFVANGRAYGLDIPYDDGEAQHVYQPDFVVRLRGGVHLVLEIKGLGGELHDPNAVQLKSEAAKKWVAAVNNAKKFGVWAFAICRSLEEVDAALAEHAGAAAQPLPFRKVEPMAGDKYRTCVPLLPLKVAAGRFRESSPEQLDLFASEEWVELPGGRRIEEGMFVAQVLGQSMAPKIADGAWCLFRRDRGGSRTGRILLVASAQISDPAYSAGYTVKKYRSEKVSDPETGEWRHAHIWLEPINPQFPTIELRVEDEGSVAVLAEFVEALGS